MVDSRIALIKFIITELDRVENMVESACNTVSSDIRHFEKHGYGEHTGKLERQGAVLRDVVDTISYASDILREFIGEKAGE